MRERRCGAFDPDAVWTLRLARRLFAVVSFDAERKFASLLCFILYFVVTVGF